MILIVMTAYYLTPILFRATYSWEEPLLWATANGFRSKYHSLIIRKTKTSSKSVILWIDTENKKTEWILKLASDQLGSN